MENKGLLPVEVDARGLNVEITKDLKAVILQKKEFEKTYNDFSKKLLQSMEENCIYQYKDDNVTISYVSASENLGFDLDALKEKYPEVYEDCLKITEKKASVRILVHKEKNK